jgi:hypothetical protein
MDVPDHRRIGRQLKIFATDEACGTGLPLWLPAGATIGLRSSGSTPGVLFNVFFVVVSGFTAADLGITQSDLSGTPGVVPAFTSSVAGLAVTATALHAEDTSLPSTPQQFTWVCAADFDTSLSAFTGATYSSPVWVTLTASISAYQTPCWWVWRWSAGCHTPDEREKRKQSR